jgi:outer membrane protein assembly factor BamB
MTRLLPALLLVLSISVVSAESWPGWRGPTSNGIAPPGKYPTSWSQRESMLWKVALPGRGASTPVVWDDQIFVTYGQDGKNILACHLQGDGVRFWATEIGAERAGKHRKASGSNSSCVTDGKLVYAYFKSGDLAAVDYEGKIVWQKNLQKLFGEDTLWWDLGTSPVLTQDNVVVACMQTGPSWLAAFNLKTGEISWKVDRDLGAPEEAAQSYSTPIVLKRDGKETIYTLGADHVTAHAAADGKEIWRVGGLNPTGHKYFRSIASPVIEGDILVAPYARGDTVTGIRLGGKGDVTKTHVLWTAKSAGTDVPTPTVKDGKVYVCRDRGTVTCLDLQTGKKLAEVTVEKSRSAFSASPILAGKLLYVTREDGKTFVLDTENELKVVASSELNENTVATPAFANGDILLRTFDHLWCIGG